MTGRRGGGCRSSSPIGRRLSEVRNLTWMARPVTEEAIQRWQDARCCGRCSFRSMDRRVLVLHRVYCDRFRELVTEVYEAQFALEDEGRYLADA